MMIKSSAMNRIEAQGESVFDTGGLKSKFLNPELCLAAIEGIMEDDSEYMVGLTTEK